MAEGAGERVDLANDHYESVEETTQQQDLSRHRRDISAEGARVIHAELAAGVLPSDVLGFPVRDPAASYPETAQRLLEAAGRLLLQGGFDALRLDAIAAEAGKNKASIKYHFGNKDGLIAALVDTMDYKECLAVTETVRDAAGDELLENLVEGMKFLTNEADAFLMFFDVLPHVIRNEGLRNRVAGLYEWYYKMNVVWLHLENHLTPENREGILGLLTLLVSITDGLAIQAALQPKGFNMDKAFAVLEYFLKHCLDDYLKSLEHESPLCQHNVRRFMTKELLSMQGEIRSA